MIMHLKRLYVSKNYQVPRKSFNFAVVPKAGPHAKDSCIPAGVFLRDNLGLAKNLSEAKNVLNKEGLLVDGRPVKDHKYPVGFMDVIAIPKIDKYYRILSEGGRLKAKEIPKKNATFKLCRLTGKKHISGSIIQYSCHDGRTFNVDAKKATYKVGDSVQMAIPEQKVKAHLPMGEGNIAMINGGKHIGAVGKIKEIQIIESPEPNMVLVDLEDRSLRTLKDYIFVIGKEKPLIEQE